MKDFDEDDMKNVINGMFSAMIEEDAIKYKDTIEHFKSKECINDPEDFDMEVMYPLQCSLAHIFKQPNSLIEYELAAIYMDYHFYESNIQTYIRKAEGHSCITDKSRWLIRTYINFLRTKELPVMGDEYWKPKFGTAEIWMDYIASLTKLRLGHPEFYLKAVVQLIPQIKGEK